MNNRVIFDLILEYNDAFNLIINMALFGNNIPSIQGIVLNNPKEVEEYYKKLGISMDEEVKRCMDWKTMVSQFEQWIPSSMKFDKGNSDGGFMKLVHIDEDGTETEIEGITESGEIVSIKYLADYEQSENFFIQAVSSDDYELFKTAIEKGVASINNYINHRVDIYNLNNPNNIIKPEEISGTSIDRKLLEFIPRINNNILIRYDQINLLFFFELETLRHTSVHPSKSTERTTMKEKIFSYNQYKYGIAGFLVFLHFIFKERIPCRIIRGSHMPEVKLSKP